MKAIICKANTDIEDLEFGEISPPAIRDHSLRIRVRAAGVNLPDRLVIQGKYQVRPKLPFIPGGEVAGDIIEIGTGANGFALGDRVAAFSTYGGYAEEIVVPVNAAFAIPETMTYAQAAGSLVAYGTAYHALFDRGHLRKGEVLLILGAAGAVGTAAIQLAKAAGATVIAGASAGKLANCEKEGADHLIDYQNQNIKDSVRALTGGRGADVIFDLVGGDAADQAMSAINWNGRFLVCGFASGTIPSIALNRVLLKGCSVTGVFWGAFNERERAKALANHEAIMALFADGKIIPRIAATYPLEKAAEALAHVSGRQIPGKAVLLTAP